MKKTSGGIMVTLLLSGMLVVAFNIQAAVASEPPETEWDRTYGGADHDGAECLVQTGDGGYALAGYTYSFSAGDHDAWLIKVDPSGNMEWNQTYGGAGNDIVHSVMQTGDGGYAMAGYTDSFGAGGWDFWLVKTYSNGTLEWSQTYGETGSDQARCMVQTGDGGYALAGTAQSFGAGVEDFWLVKTDSDGNEEWNETYGGARDDWAFSVIQTSDGGFAITGWTSSSGAGGRDVWLIKTNSTGDAEWNHTYGETGWEQGNSVIQTPDGGYAIAGHTTSFGARGWDWFLLTTDSSGDLLWCETYGGAYDDYGQDVQQTSDGGYIIVGYTQVSSVGGSFDGWLVKTNSTGQMQWDQTFGEADVRDEFKSVIKTSDSGHALAGAKGGPLAGGSGDFDFWLMKLAGVVIPATIDIAPDTLNLKSSGQWITAYIELPEEYSPTEIDVSSILLNGSISVDPEAPTEEGDYDGDSIPDLMVKFQRVAIIEWLGTVDYGEDTGKSVAVALVITGEASGTPFEGVDTVRVLLKG